jgi:alpha-amylase
MESRETSPIRVVVFVLALAVGGALVPSGARAQAGFDDDRVMLQGFYWESYRHGHPDHFPAYGNKHWYAIVKDQAQAIREARFDLVWLPPPSYAGEGSAGYNPKELFRLDNSYGDFVEHTAMLRALLQNGVEPVADMVLNHRDGSTGWADFKNPDWGTWAICGTDEAFTTPASGVMGATERGACEEQSEYQQGLTYNYPGLRDIAHPDLRVRNDVIRMMLFLKSLGYRGWRYDMVHGFHAKWIACYNAATTPTFSVGEYDWDKQAQQRVGGSGRRPPIRAPPAPITCAGRAASSTSPPTSASRRSTAATTAPCTATGTASAWWATRPTGCHGRTVR